MVHLFVSLLVNQSSQFLPGDPSHIRSGTSILLPEKGPLRFWSRWKRAKYAQMIISFRIMFHSASQNAREGWEEKCCIFFSEGNGCLFLSNQATRSFQDERQSLTDECDRGVMRKSKVITHTHPYLKPM